MTHEDIVKVYMEIEREYYTKNVKKWCKEKGIKLTDKQIDDAVDSLVWEFEYDMTFWDNVEQAVRYAMEKKE